MNNLISNSCVPTMIILLCRRRGRLFFTIPPRQCQHILSAMCAVNRQIIFNTYSYWIRWCGPFVDIIGNDTGNDSQIHTAVESSSIRLPVKYNKKKMLFRYT